MPLLRYLWLFAGILALLVGLVGVVTPILPTTPLVILAAFCFAKSSPRLHNWLLDHKTFGPMIRDWRDRGAIPKRAKIIASLSIAAAFLISVMLGLPPSVLLIQGVILCAVTVFIWTRPN